MSDLPGHKFKKAMAEESPLQLVGVVNAYTAVMAQSIGESEKQTVSDN